MAISINTLFLQTAKIVECFAPFTRPMSKRMINAIEKHLPRNNSMEITDSGGCRKSYLFPKRKRRALSLMKPSASRWL